MKEVEVKVEDDEGNEKEEQEDNIGGYHYVLIGVSSFFLLPSCFKTTGKGLL